MLAGIWARRSSAEAEGRVKGHGLGESEVGESEGEQAH